MQQQKNMYGGQMPNTQYQMNNYRGGYQGNNFQQQKPYMQPGGYNQYPYEDPYAMYGGMGNPYGQYKPGIMNTNNYPMNDYSDYNDMNMKRNNMGGVGVSNKYIYFN